MTEGAPRSGRSTVLGTAGHIDHGKTALVRMLTGTDTDRLAEEKARGITIELGFAEMAMEGGGHLGVVDVPGHEAFVRAMVAGAAGMDIVLLAVAADEGVMPQTREHLAIVELLAVPQLVVALTKCDAVDEEWLQLVEADVEETLAATPYAGAPLVRTSALEGRGLGALREALAAAAARVGLGASDDLARLPLDRVFTMSGTGTVVTGTLWSGRLRAGERVRVLPDDVEARIRTVQVHGRPQDGAEAGDRTALALSGEGGDRAIVARGATIVTEPAWPATSMLTVRARLLERPGWSLRQNQRVHVHLGTSSVLGRCALIEGGALAPGQSGWIQLRLEEPVVARGRDRVVLRAYSPMTTIGGGVVAEPLPKKRKALNPAEAEALQGVLEGSPTEAVAAHLELAGWAGSERALLPVHVGLSPSAVAEAVTALSASGCLVTDRRAFGSTARLEAERWVLEAVDAGHDADALRAAVPLAFLRAALPPWGPPDLADAVLGSLAADGRLELVEGGARRPGYRPEPSADQAEASSRLERIFLDGGLAPPTLEELPEPLRARPDLRSLLRRLEESGSVRQIADGMFVAAGALDRAVERVQELLAGRTGLGPADFREALPVTRKHLIPLLNYLDGRGTTQRGERGRDVPARG